MLKSKRWGFSYHNKLAKLEYLREFIAHAERKEQTLWTHIKGLKLSQVKWEKPARDSWILKESKPLSLQASLQPLLKIFFYIKAWKNVFLTYEPKFEIYSCTYKSLCDTQEANTTVCKTISQIMWFGGFIQVWECFSETCDFHNISNFDPHKHLREHQ